jgi:hypothetical protein
MLATPAPRWFTPKKAAAHLRVTEKTLETWRSGRRGPAWSKRGRVIRYDVNDLDAFLAEGRQEPLDAAPAQA